MLSRATPNREHVAEEMLAAFQILSGGVVLQLKANEKVWLRSFKDQQTDSEARDTQEKNIKFSGFLLFSDDE